MLAHNKYIALQRFKREQAKLCKQCGSSKIDNYKYCILCRKQHRQAGKRHSLKLKLKVFKKYGGSSCQCCQETTLDFLTIDHINKDGAKHRKQIGFNIYRWLRNNNYPYGFRVLCMNCNWALRFRSQCPHKEIKYVGK